MLSGQEECASDGEGEVGQHIYEPVTAGLRKERSAGQISQGEAGENGEKHDSEGRFIRRVVVERERDIREYKCDEKNRGGKVIVYQTPLKYIGIAEFL